MKIGKSYHFDQSLLPDPTDEVATALVAACYAYKLDGFADLNDGCTFDESLSVCDAPLYFGLTSRDAHSAIARNWAAIYHSLSGASGAAPCTDFEIGVHHCVCSEQLAIWEDMIASGDMRDPINRDLLLLLAAHCFSDPSASHSLQLGAMEGRITPSCFLLASDDDDWALALPEEPTEYLGADPGFYMRVSECPWNVFEASADEIDFTRVVPMVNEYIEGPRHSRPPRRKPAPVSKTAAAFLQMQDAASRIARTLTQTAHTT